MTATEADGPAGANQGTRGEGEGSPSDRPSGTHGISLVPEPLEESEVEAELEGLDVDAPRVGIVMGSKSDLETMQKAADELKERGHPARDAGDVGPPRAGPRRRIRQERTHAGTAGDHRRRRDLGGPSGCVSPPTRTCR